MKVIPKNDFNPSDPRYVIADDNGKVVDDAQGFGFKTKRNAHRCLSYKYNGGKQKKNKKKKFFKENPNIKKEIDELFEINFKEIARGDVTLNDIKEFIDEKFDIDLPKEYLK